MDINIGNNSGQFFDGENPDNLPQRPIYDYSSWKFYLPHVWDARPKQWGDIYLMPDEFEYQENKSIWLTINAIVVSDETREKVFDFISSSKSDVKRRTADYQRKLDRYEQRIEAMGEKDFLIDYEQQEMYVRAESFTKDQFVEWAMLYLQESGVEFPQMRETELDEFSGSNQHAAAVEEASGRLDDFLDGKLPTIPVEEEAEEHPEN